MHVSKLSDFHSNNYLKLLIYGDSGVGKTCWAVTLPGPVLVYDFDNKISSAFNLLSHQDPKKLEQIGFMSFSTNRVSDRPHASFRLALEELEKKVKEGKFPFKTVVLDSLTLYTEAMLADVVYRNPGARRAIPGIPALQDYMVAKQDFTNDIGRLLSLPCNVVCVGHIKEYTNEKTGEIKNKVMLHGQLADYAPKVFREVYRAYVKREKDGSIMRYLQTQSDGQYECRSELLKVPAHIPMNYEELIKYQIKKGEPL